MLQRGNLDAFDEIFEKYKDRAVRTAYLITGNLQISEDIVQETFIQCYNHINALKNPGGFRSWFYKILTRTAWKYGKTANIEVATDNIMEKADEHRYDESMAKQLQSELKMLLYDSIEKLEPKLKTILILYYYNGLTTKEIAASVGCFEGTVKSRLFTARHKLRKYIEIIDNSQGKECYKNAKCKTI